MLRTAPFVGARWCWLAAFKGRALYCSHCTLQHIVSNISIVFFSMYRLLVLATSWLAFNMVVQDGPGSYRDQQDTLPTRAAHLVDCSRLS